MLHDIFGSPFTSNLITCIQSQHHLFHSTGISGKDAAMQVTSKALMKKSVDNSLHYKGNAIIETAPETDEALQQVTQIYTENIHELLERLDMNGSIS